VNNTDVSSGGFMKKLISLSALTCTLFLASCGQQTPTIVDSNTASNSSNVLEGLVIKPNTMTEVTKQQFEAIQELRRAGKSISEIANDRLLAPQYLYNVPTNEFCSNATKVGPGGTISSIVLYTNTYNIKVQMYAPFLYTSYEIDVFADSQLVKTSYTNTALAPIATGKTVQIDAIASGRSYSVGYMDCKT
jgi:hypothetical protein